jgi:hypothetical protein
MKVTMLVTAMLLAPASGAVAQNADIEAGAAYAEQVCSPCRAVLPNENLSPLPRAPTFQWVGDTPGMTELALTVFLQSSTRPCPISFSNCGTSSPISAA